jgi:signal transduction histidine kinase
LWNLLLLLAAVVLVPVACLLWFMNKAMQNERLAVRQKLAEAYLGHLSTAQERLERYWQEKASALDGFEEGTSGSQFFARCVRSGIADSVICYDSRGRLLYPASPLVPKTDPTERDPKWMRAKQLEEVQNNLIAAAQAYGEIARSATNANLAARALQAQARCLVQAGRKGSAIQVVVREFGHERFRRATDLQMRLIAVDAELMALQLMGSPAHARFGQTLKRLRTRLSDYENPALGAAQRLFLMKQVRKLPIRPADRDFPTLEAEELAARVLDTRPQVSKEAVLRPTAAPGVWQFASSSGRVLALFHTENLQTQMGATIAARALPTDVSVSIEPPGQELAREGVYQQLDAGRQLPGWRLALSLRGGELLSDAADEQIAVYLWTGILGIAAISILAVFIARTLQRQIRLTRLKNDLVATVSHELKTPLSSMRLLVDTLLEAGHLEEQKAREYLQLVAKENRRLSHLIDNFLAFSRMEQNRNAFDRKEVSPSDIVRGAADAVHERFRSTGCRFDVQIAPNLPNIFADPDALTTVLLNLLDNAYKYSEGDRAISLRAYAGNGNVCFAVTDNGIGLAQREAKKVFERFYQADRRLSRNTGGCGLGLSIVKFIVTAHGGGVRVDSQSGEGSTFMVTIPRVAAGSPATEGALA